jgi:hypothetical protein
MKIHAQLCLVAVFVLGMAPVYAGSPYPKPHISSPSIPVKTACITCKAKCMKCVPPQGRGIFPSRDACFADCDRRGNKLLNTTCGVTGAESRAGCS